MLAHQVNTVNTAQATVEAWYFTSIGFGTFASLSIARARSIVKAGRYSNDLNDTIREYTRRLLLDATAAAITAIISLIPIISLPSNRDQPTTLDYAAVSTLAAMCCAGFVSHCKARKLLMNALQRYGLPGLNGGTPFAPRPGTDDRMSDSTKRA